MEFPRTFFPRVSHRAKRLHVRMQLLFRARARHRQKDLSQSLDIPEPAKIGILQAVAVRAVGRINGDPGNIATRYPSCYRRERGNESRGRSSGATSKASQPSPTAETLFLRTALCCGTPQALVDARVVAATAASRQFSAPSPEHEYDRHADPCDRAGIGDE